MAISFGKKKHQYEDDVIDSENIDEHGVIEEVENDDGDDEQEMMHDAIEKKKKQQKMIILGAAVIGAVAMIGYFFLMKGNAPRQVSVAPAQQGGSQPAPQALVNGQRGSQAAIIAAKERFDEEAMRALESQGVQLGENVDVQGVPANEPLSDMGGPQEGGKQGGERTGDARDTLKIGAPMMKIDEADISSSIDSMKYFIGESFSTLTNVINKNQMEVINKLEEISKKIESSPSNEKRGGGGAATADGQRQISAQPARPRVSSAWRLSRVEGEYAIVVSSSTGEYVAVRKGDSIPGVGRVSEVSAERVIAGGVEIRG